MPVQPTHADHIQPTEAPWLLEVARRTQVTASQATLAAATIRRWIVPCDGMIENVRFKLDVCGTGGGPSTVELQNAGTNILAAAMSIAHDDVDGTEVVGTFTDADDAEVSRGDVLTIEVTAAATGGAADGHVHFTFVALGRSA